MVLLRVLSSTVVQLDKMCCTAVTFLRCITRMCIMPATWYTRANYALPDWQKTLCPPSDSVSFDGIRAIALPSVQSTLSALGLLLFWSTPSVEQIHIMFCCHQI